jgi:hypothetical protein
MDKRTATIKLISGRVLCCTDVELANLRTEVAVGIGGLIDGVVEDQEGRSIVVANVVECWTRLESSAREAYHSRPGHSAVSDFGGDYAEEVDRVWRADVDAAPFSLHDRVIDELSRLAWCIHIARVQRRNLLGQPPDPTWLARFPSDECRQ